jgi:endonuclease/exonuclease/phosphatase family metal-dependent hydrolase
MTEEKEENKSGHDTARVLRIHSYNIRYNNTPKNFKAIAERLAREQVNYDVICLQEAPTNFPQQLVPLAPSFAIKQSYGEILLVRKTLQPVFHVWKNIASSGKFHDIEQRQQGGRPFVYALLQEVNAVVGTAHVWSVFEELDGKTWTSTQEKVDYLRQCFVAMDTRYPGAYFQLLVGDTNLMADGERMQKVEHEKLGRAGLFDLVGGGGAQAAAPTWDGVGNPTQISHREIHRPDRAISSSQLKSAVFVTQSALSDHYPIDVIVPLDQMGEAVGEEKEEKVEASVVRAVHWNLDSFVGMPLHHASTRSFLAGWTSLI